jgi:hypothetical protein
MYMTLCILFITNAIMSNNEDNIHYELVATKGTGERR